MPQGVPVGVEAAHHRSKRHSHHPAGNAAAEAGRASGHGPGEAGRIPDRPGIDPDRDPVGTAGHMGEGDPVGRKIAEAGIGRKRVGPVLTCQRWPWYDYEVREGGSSVWVSWGG